MFSTVEGHLVFEDDDGNSFTVSAQKLTALLTEHRIPIMVLNACRSAGIDTRATDPFASTAAALLKAGVRSVVAMSYNLYVSGAQQFVPAFYSRLLKTGDVTEATRDGRKAMLLNDARACARGEYPLQDWLVPVLYQQEIVPLPVQSTAKTEAPVSRLPEEAQALGDYGFIGRQSAIHQLERALQRQPAAAVLIHGMAGIGKTTLAQGFLQWLEQTGALPVADGASPASEPFFIETLWFAFDDIRSAEFVVNRLTAACLSHQATSLPMEEKLPAMTRALREQPRLIVWDNFESAAGIDGTEVYPLLTEPDRILLKGVLKDLRGGRSKFLITSRSPEHWLAPTEAFRLPLHGLRGEDVWTYCNAVMRDLALKLDRHDSDAVELLEELEGHPLALRSVLLQLTDTPARELLQRLKKAFDGHASDESTRRIFAVLDLLNQSLPGHYTPILQLIGLHQRCVNIDLVAAMMNVPKEEGTERAHLHSCFSALERSGLLHHVGNGVYNMHPALHGFLAVAHPAEQDRCAQFVQCMAEFADTLTPKHLHEQRIHFARHGANFQTALALANAADEDNAAAALTRALASFALNSRDFEVARHHLDELAARLLKRNDGSEAQPYHNLGVIAGEQHDFSTAERWYLKSLAIEEKFGNEHGAVTTYHQLGTIAQEQRDFAAAKGWYLKALAIAEKLDSEDDAAGTYHQLGMIAEEQRDFATAKGWYLKALSIAEKLGNEHGAALTYHQLGVIAQEQHDFSTAERWYLKSLSIAEKLGNEHGAASTYHQLGVMADAQDDFSAAERWFLKSLNISEKLGDQHRAGGTYHQLGITAQKQRAFSAAERWYLKSLAIAEKLGNEHGAASTYHQLGMIAREQSDFPTAEGWYLKALAIEEKLGDTHSAALIYAALGTLHSALKDFGKSTEFFLEAMRKFASTNDRLYFLWTLQHFIRSLRSADPTLQPTLRERWHASGLEQCTSLEEAERNFHE